MENVEDAVKVIVVGNGGVGKSSLLRRYCKGDFTSEYKKTIGTDFLEKDVFLKSVGEEVKLMLWDTAGQEVFDALTAQYYRGAGACVLAFSTVDRESFQAVKSWKDKVENVCGKGNVVMALMQTKIDLIEKTVVQSHEAESLARELGVKFFRTSTKENFNIDPVFEYLAETYLSKGSKGEAENMAITAGSGTTGTTRGHSRPADATPVRQFAGGGGDSEGATTAQSSSSTSSSSSSSASHTPTSPSTTNPSSAAAAAPRQHQPIRINEPVTRRATRKKRWNCTIL